MRHTLGLQMMDIKAPAVSGQFPLLNQSCPFSIRKLNSTTFLIRERDKYGEFPHIYAIFRNASLSEWDSDPEEPKVIILSDTGVGTEVRNDPSLSAPTTGDEPWPRLKWQWESQPEPETWTLATFLAFAINPGHQHPYLVISTHCHYDHILGFNSLLKKDGSQQPHVSVVVSALADGFITPYANLQQYSLCNSLKLDAPDYTSSIVLWAENETKIVYHHPSGADIDTAITALVTPGHTPDSLSWFDGLERVICVGDLFYTAESSTTEKSGWGKGGKAENPAPVIFVKESVLVDWHASLEKLDTFVRERDRVCGLLNGLQKLERDVRSVNEEFERRITSLEEDWGPSPKYLMDGLSRHTDEDNEGEFDFQGLAVSPMTLYLEDKLQGPETPAGSSDQSTTGTDVNVGYLSTNNSRRATIPTTITISSPASCDTASDDWTIVNDNRVTLDPAYPITNRLMSTMSSQELRHIQASRRLNTRYNQIRLAASHVMDGTYREDPESQLVRIQTLLSCIVCGSVPMVSIPDSRGEKMGQWNERRSGSSSFIVQAPLRVIEEAKGKKKWWY